MLSAGAANIKNWAFATSHYKGKVTFPRAAKIFPNSHKLACLQLE